MKIFCFAILLVAVCACHQLPPHTPTEIESAMNHYDSLLKKMDADSIAWLYAPDGQLGTIARGRDSIRRFLASFKDVRVLEVGSTNKDITIKIDTAFHTGTYFQDVILLHKDTAHHSPDTAHHLPDTLHLKGSFTAEWIWSETEGWKIRKMTTKPE
ncbi:MAG: hypothetical protein JST68_23995 [Bacteroidetes bacterium]|nr:hypothetical protein [Bacteroidota bacterium]